MLLTAIDALFNLLTLITKTKHILENLFFFLAKLQKYLQNRYYWDRIFLKFIFQKRKEATNRFKISLPIEANRN